jgi:hypothetical protein
VLPWSPQTALQQVLLPPVDHHAQTLLLLPAEMLRALQVPVQAGHSCRQHGGLNPQRPAVKVCQRHVVLCLLLLLLLLGS